jgi:hypothetical protein
MQFCDLVSLVAPLARFSTKRKGRTFADGIFIETPFLPKCNFATPQGENKVWDLGGRMSVFLL